ncbi:SLC13 family permease [Thalassospira sp.]|uniref:SLC13 family permease n=1 Tax=Thalassospira sp. TaxID=1912094 RepID=UPI000C468BC5|nr:SLC13 family permease [Thalassospira sp.]MBC05117.1 SLC13 family permease [Thalassospira sp.]|tara:strand:+ start:190 stop:2196 length:2007 start_codon:yes stop_codon:yes gene_type:complete
MTTPQIMILAVLLGTVVLFLWGRWRHDMVAMASLLVCVVLGLVPTDAAFVGFGHPAVITVACILILSSALQRSGAVDTLSRTVLPQSAGPFVTMAALSLLAAILSAFMNNVGALALLMPIALQVANKQDLPPGKILMPLAFGSILGGMTTLIGTPPNLIVSGFRAEATGSGFSMFDYSPVGIAIALAGLAFVILFGRFLVPNRERAGAEGFETGSYLTEARITEGSKATGMLLRDINEELEKSDAQIIGLIRNETRIPAPSQYRELKQDDILLIEAEPEGLASALGSLELTLEAEWRDARAKEAAKEAEKQKALEEKEAEKEAEQSDNAEEPAKTKAQQATKPAEKEIAAQKDDAKDSADKGDEHDDNEADKKAEPHKKPVQSDDISLIEVAVLPNAAFIGRSAADIRIRSRYGVNLLAISRQGHRSMSRLRTMKMRAGDVLLMQGTPAAIHEFGNRLGCVPLAERSLNLGDKTQALKATGIMAIAIALAAFGILPAAIAFALGVLATLLTGVVSPRTLYDAVDWPVVVLLAALIPVANAMESTGSADLIARFLLESVAQGNAVIAVGLILVVTMTLSDFMNNAATAAVMCPIAIGSAAQLDASSDPFLMAVAIGASCAFLTPIGHQNNTLILGPGGFRFGDYWRLGLPIEIIVVAVGVPTLLWVWPL